MRNISEIVRRLAVVVIAALAVYSAGYGQEAQKGNLALDKRKAEIVSGLDQAEEYLTRLRLQDLRARVELLNHKLGLIQSGLSVQDAASLKAKIDNLSARAAAKEDSLVKVPMTILYSKGMDAALAYLQNELRTYGVNEKKTEATEKKLLAEGPKVRQDMERKAIERTTKALMSGKSPEPDLDPYILAAAQRAVKAHADSITAVENAKKRKIEEQQRLEKIRIEKEKKLAEEKAARIALELEKKKQMDAEVARKKVEAAQKAHQDSIAAMKRDSAAAVLRHQQQIEMQEKERQRKITAQQQEAARLAKAEEDRKKQEQAQKLALLQKAYNDSLAAIRRDSIAAVQKILKEKEAREKERLAVLFAEQKKQELAEQAEKNRKKQEVAARNDSLATLQRIQEDKQKEREAKQAQEEKAQALTVELYAMLDKKQAKKALEEFGENQGFLVSAMELDAYTALDHAIVRAVILELTDPSAGKKDRQGTVSAARQTLDKINTSVRDDKIESAYSAFKFTERALAGSMAKSDFLLLKSLVESSYRDLKRGVPAEKK
jgi:hypothetical protein